MIIARYQVVNMKLEKDGSKVITLRRLEAMGTVSASSSLEVRLEKDDARCQVDLGDLWELSDTPAGNSRAFTTIIDRTNKELVELREYKKAREVGDLVATGDVPPMVSKSPSWPATTLPAIGQEHPDAKEVLEVLEVLEAQGTPAGPVRWLEPSDPPVAAVAPIDSSRPTDPAAQLKADIAEDLGAAQVEGQVTESGRFPKKRRPGRGGPWPPPPPTTPQPYKPWVPKEDRPDDVD